MHQARCPLCQDQSLGNWRIKRQILEGEEISYKFTPKYVLRAGQTVTVGGCGRAGGAGWDVGGSWEAGSAVGWGGWPREQLCLVTGHLCAVVPLDCPWSPGVTCQPPTVGEGLGCLGWRALAETEDHGCGPLRLMGLCSLLSLCLRTGVLGHRTSVPCTLSTVLSQRDPGGRDRELTGAKYWAQSQH